MYNKFLILLVTALCGADAVARGLTECTKGEGEYAYMVGTECMTISEISAQDGVDCWRLFNVPLWYGVFYSEGVNNNCYISVPDGYALNTDFIFDEDRYEEALVICDNGLYCPFGGIKKYAEVMAQMGSTIAFAEYCPSPKNIYKNPELTRVPSSGDGLSSTSGASAIDDCFIVPGTYYDETGAFEITANCAY